MASISTLIDDFNGPFVDGVIWTAGGSSVAGNVFVNNNQVNIYHGPAAETNKLSTVATYDLTGAAAHIQVKSYGDTSQANHSVQYYLFLDASNYYVFYTGGTTLNAASNIAAAFNTTAVGTIGDALRWLRIRESGGTVFWDTSPDGVTWTAVNSVAAGFVITGMEVILQAQTSGDTKGNQGIFDNFNTLDGSPYAYHPVDVANPHVGPMSLRRRLRRLSPTIPRGTGITDITAVLDATARTATASLSGSQTQTGTIAAQLAKALFSGAGTQTQTGTITALLKAATASLAGIEHPRGSISGTARKATASFTGAQQQSGSISATSKNLTASLAGALQPSGTILASAKKSTAALTGIQTQTGTISAAARAMVSALSGTQTEHLTGTIAAAAHSAIATVTGAQEQTGAISAAMRAAVATMSGVMQPAGFVTVTIQHLTCAASGAQAQEGIIGAALTSSLFSGSGTQSALPGTAAPIMKKLNASLSGHEAPEGVVAAAMNLAQFAGQGKHGQQGIVAATLPAAIFAAAGNQPTAGALSVVLHRMVFSGQGTQTGMITGTMFAQAKRLIVALTGAMVPAGQVAAALSAPSFEGSADYSSPLGLRSVLRALVFHSLRTAHDSAERTTIIPGENRTTIIPGENRTTLIPNEDRLTLIDT